MRPTPPPVSFTRQHCPGASRIHPEAITAPATRLWFIRSPQPRARSHRLFRGHSWPVRVPAWGRSARLDGEPKLQGLRDTPAVEVDIRHLPVVRLAVVRLDILQAHRDRVGGWVPAGYGTWLGPVDVELAARPCFAAAPVPPGQPPGNGRSAHADVDDVRALNHPGPAGYVRLHPHLDGSGAGRPDGGRVSALAGRTACRQTARHSGRCDDAQDSGCAAH